MQCSPIIIYIYIYISIWLPICMFILHYCIISTGMLYLEHPCMQNYSRFVKLNYFLELCIFSGVSF